MATSSVQPCSSAADPPVALFRFGFFAGRAGGGGTSSGDFRFGSLAPPPLKSTGFFAARGNLGLSAMILGFWSQLTS